MHFREIPFLRLLIPLCAGVILAEVIPGYLTPALVILCCLLALLSVRLLRKSYNLDIFFGVSLFLTICCSGYILSCLPIKERPSLEQNRQVIVARISEYPDRKASGVSFRARIIAAGSDTLKSVKRGSILLYYMTDSLNCGLGPGDKLMVRTGPMPVRNNGNPCEFNYKRYMEGQGVCFYGFFRKSDIIELKPANHLTVRELSLVTAKKMIDTFSKQGLKDEDLGLVAALTIGEKDLLDRDLLTSFSRTGAMHIMAVSGLHVGMISLCLSYLLFFLKRRFTILKIILILIVLWAFAFITGLSPSVLRATIMFSFLQAGKIFNREGNSMNILLASAFILIIARPGVLFEAGFQLSYLAVGFIIAFYEPLYRMIRIRNKLADYLWQMIAVSIVAQAGTIALTVRLFNTFPLMFLATNLVVIPISFAVVVLAFLLTFTCSIASVSIVLVSVLKFLSRTILGFTSWAASLKNGVIENIGMSATETIILTIAIALLLFSVLRMTRMTLRPFLVACSLLLIVNIGKNYRESRVEKEITYNIRGREVRAYQSGRHLFIMSEEESVPPEIKKHAATRGLVIDMTKHPE